MRASRVLPVRGIDLTGLLLAVVQVPRSRTRPPRSCGEVPVSRDAVRGRLDKGAGRDREPRIDPRTDTALPPPVDP